MPRSPLRGMFASGTRITVGPAHTRPCAGTPAPPIVCSMCDPRPAFNALILCATALLGCAPLPGGLSSGNAPPPPLLPLDTLLAGVDAPGATAATADTLAGRAARLRTRAALMRAPVLDPATRARLAAAIARGDA
jgi:hypothetical protein